MKDIKLNNRSAFIQSLQQFLRQIQFFKNHWQRLSNRLPVFIIKPFDTLIIETN